MKDDAILAHIEPVIRYSPSDPDWRTLREQKPQIYWWQGLTMGRLEAMLDLITVPSSAHPEGRLMGFGEFELLYEDVFNDADEHRRKMLAAAASAVYCFRPPDRPVFWRMMLAQARIYQALLRTKGHSFIVPVDAEGWQAVLRLEGESDFDWREGGPGR